MNRSTPLYLCAITGLLFISACQKSTQDAKPTLDVIAVVEKSDQEVYSRKCRTVSQEDYIIWAEANRYNHSYRTNRIYEPDIIEDVNSDALNRAKERIKAWELETETVHVRVSRSGEIWLREQAPNRRFEQRWRMDRRWQPVRGGAYLWLSPVKKEEGASRIPFWHSLIDYPDPEVISDYLHRKISPARMQALLRTEGLLNEKDLPWLKETHTSFCGHRSCRKSVRPWRTSRLVNATFPDKAWGRIKSWELKSSDGALLASFENGGGLWMRSNEGSESQFSYSYWITGNRWYACKGGAYLLLSPLGSCRSRARIPFWHSLIDYPDPKIIYDYLSQKIGPEEMEQLLRDKGLLNETWAEPTELPKEVKP